MNKKKIALPIVAAAIVIISVCAMGIHCLLLHKEGFVGVERVQIDGVDYRYADIVYSGEGKTIAFIDDWEVNEIPEDSSNTFVVVRSFLDQYPIVRADYEIPESGRVSCAYIGDTMERTTDKDLLKALTDILQADYTGGKEIFLLSDMGSLGNFQHICVGYEDCPVGTDNSIYYIGIVDSRWVVIFRDELGERKNDRVSARYYELDAKYGAIFEDSGYWGN